MGIAHIFGFVDFFVRAIMVLILLDGITSLTCYDKNNESQNVVGTVYSFFLVVVGTVFYVWWVQYQVWRVQCHIFYLWWVKYQLRRFMF